jgi:hypothetical protein
MGDLKQADLRARVAAFAAYQSERISALTADRVRIDPQQVMDRSLHLPLAPPTGTSPNGQCRLIPCRDAWLAVNLPRADDRSLLPAWLGVDEDAAESCIDAAIAEKGSETLIEDAVLMGLAVSIVGERGSDQPYFQLTGGSDRGQPAQKIVDMSSLWAGPLCGSILAAAGCDVVKIESRTRPDPVRSATPAFDQILNGQKQRAALDFRDGDALRAELLSADILITSARPRAFAALGISPEQIWAENPALTWIAITAHGWDAGDGMRVGFGDDCAAAGGLVAWRQEQPHFLGDALGDPLTGMLAGVKALETRHLGGAFLDMSLAGTSAMASAFSTDELR